MNYFTQKNSPVDLLKTLPSQKSYEQRIELLGLSGSLEQKALQAQNLLQGENAPTKVYLAEKDEKELATEVLLHRHTFTQYVFENRTFRQAALTVIQNIYLFKQRRIFFGTTSDFGEPERRLALQLFSDTSQKATIKLIHTFQHFMLARVWYRISSQASPAMLASPEFHRLHDVVENLTTLRNIYMSLSTGLVRKLTRTINPVYSQSICCEDARQIGSFGIARAAYRYHPAIGIRFSTYAGYWILREIQRQALAGRLIRISADLVEKCARETKKAAVSEETTFRDRLSMATTLSIPQEEHASFAENASPGTTPDLVVEKKELHQRLLEEMGRTLPEKYRDVLERRFGLGRFTGKEQSVIEIAQAYGVCRSSIYQLEQRGLKKLRQAMANALS